MRIVTCNLKGSGLYYTPSFGLFIHGYDYFSSRARPPACLPTPERSVGEIANFGRTVNRRTFARTVATMAIDLRLLSMAMLRGPYPKTETIPLPSLYKDKPVVLYAIRRMGW